MADYKERRFSIDPGKGKKMDGCPYSTYEDGRDVKDYIIPPKGYLFKGFRFDPDANNQIYDGKLIAEYEKEPFNNVLKSNLWKLLLALVIIGVITCVALLAANVFKNPKPDKPVKNTKPVAVTTDTVKTVDTTPKVAIQKNDSVTTKDTIKPEPDDVIVDLNDKTNTQEPEVAPTPPVADDPNVQFKQEFWSLIHQRTIMMDPYHELYINNKDKVEGEEYDYLRFTILKDFNAFKTWYGKLNQIPVSELENINTVNDLKKKIGEI